MLSEILKKSSPFSPFSYTLRIKLTNPKKSIKIGNECTVTMRASSPTEKERPVSQPGELTNCKSELSLLKPFSLDFLTHFLDFVSRSDGRLLKLGLLRQRFICWTAFPSRKIFERRPLTYPLRV